MKKIFTALLLLIGLSAFSQSIGYFRYDSTRFEKVGGNNELIILNSTRNVTGGVLTNLGNGRTGFVLPGSGSGNGISAVFAGYGLIKINDSTLRVDTNFTSGLVTAWRLQKTRDSLLALIAGKQASGNYITALTGDVTASGPGSVAATLSNTGVTAGSYSVPNITVDAKGRVTNISTGPTIPAQFNPIAGTNMSLSGTYPNITFNASGGGGGSPNTSVGAGYRVAINATNNIKSLKEKYGVTLDSATTGEVGITADTTVGVGIISWSRYLKLKDSIASVYTPMTRTFTGGYGINTIGDLSANRTVSVDTATIQPKNLLYPASVEKSGVTVRFKNDVVNPGPDRVYATNDVEAKGWHRTMSYDSSARTDSSIMIWDDTNKKLIFSPYPTGGGGSGDYTTPFRIQLFPGARTRDPAVGDSVVQRDTFQGRCIEHIIRNGLYQLEGDTLQGYTFNDVSGTITFHPKFVASERLELKFGNCSDTAQIPSAGVSWVDLTFTTNTGLSNTGNEWTGTTNNNWDQYGLDALRLTGDGSIAMQYASTASKECILGFNASNVSETFSGYEYGVYLATAGALTRIVNGSPTSLGVSLNVGDWVRVNRTGTTFKIQTSTDKSNWTDRYTFAATSSATHYVNLAVFKAVGTTGKASFPQGLGLVP